MSSNKTKSINLGNYKTIIVHNSSLNSSCVGCIIKCGSTNDNKGKNGICSVVNYILLNGKNAKSIISKAERIGFKIQYNFEREYTYLYVTTHTNLYSEATEIIMQLIDNFNCTFEDIENAKTYVKHRIAYENDNIDYAIDNAIHEHIFTRQLIGKPKHGKLKTLESITQEDVISFFNKNYNYKNIVIVVSSPNTLEAVQSKLQSIHLRPVCEQKQTFSSFKRYTMHKKIKHIYKHTKMSYGCIIFPMDGFRIYDKKISANILVKILNGHTKSVLDESYQVQLIEYNSVSIMIIKFQVFDVAILDEVKNILNKINNFKISEVTYSEIIKGLVNDYMSINKDVEKSTKSYAIHFLNVRKIKRPNFDLQIMHECTKELIQTNLKHAMSIASMSLLVFGPKNNKQHVNKIDL